MNEQMSGEESVNAKLEVIQENADFIICPQCNSQVEKGAKFCIECGYGFHKKKNKKWLVVILLGFIVISVVIGGVYALNCYSQSVYKKAEQYNKTGNYDEAIEYYEKVIPTFFNSYKGIEKKINAAKELIRKEKIAAKAIVALNEAGTQFDINVIKSIYIADKENSSTVWGKDTIFVRETVNQTDCIYCVSKKEIASLKLSEFPYYKEEKYGYNVYAIGEDNSTKWLSNAWDVITNKWVSMVNENTTELNMDNIKQIINTYYETKDETLFE